MTPERVIPMKPSAERRTVVVHNRLTLHETRLAAARGRRHGLQIMTFEQLAARLAGGLVRPVDDDALREAIGSVLTDTEPGEPGGIPAAVILPTGTRKRSDSGRSSAARQRGPAVPRNPQRGGGPGSGKRISNVGGPEPP